MLKKSITYTDYNDQEQTEDFYFNFTKTELTEMEVSVDTGYSAMLKQIAAAENRRELLLVFKTILTGAVGIKTPDGKRFVKNSEIAQAFVESPAFDMLFMELATDEDKCIAFMKGIVPSELSSSFDAQH